MSTSPTTARWDYDVIQIGCGPVGQAMAAQLGQRSHRMAVFERWPQRYRPPRAGHLDSLRRQLDPHLVEQPA